MPTLLMHMQVGIAERRARLPIKYNPASPAAAAPTCSCISAGCDDVDTYPRILPDILIHMGRATCIPPPCPSAPPPTPRCGFESMPMATLISSLLSLLRLRVCSIRAAFGAHAPCAPAIRDPRFRHAHAPVSCPQLMSALRGVSSLGRHVGTEQRRVDLFDPAAAESMPMATLISSLLPLLRPRACGTRAAFGAHAPCAPAIRDPRFRHAHAPVSCPKLMSALRGVSSLGRHVGTEQRRGVFVHSDAVAHAALVVILTSAICTSAGVAGTERSFLGQQMRFLTAT